MEEKQQMLPLMRRINCFLILKRPVGNFMASLLEVEEVILGVVPSLGLIILQQLIQLLHQTLPLLPPGLYHPIKASF